MNTRARTRRTVLRYTHLAVGALMATYVYLPPGDAPWLRWALMLAGVPAVTVTGLWMWKQATIRRLLARRGSRTQAELSAAALR
jgi:hypothetical protein